MNSLRHEGYVSKRAAGHAYCEWHPAFNSGVTVGTFPAEAAQDPVAFCAEATDYRKIPDARHHWE